MKKTIKQRSIHAINAWNRRGAGTHKNKKWLQENKRRKVSAEDG